MKRFQKWTKGGCHILEKNKFGTIGNDWDLQFEDKDCSSYNSCDTKSTKVVIQLNYVKQKVWFERTLEQYWNRAVNRWPISLFDRAGLAGSELNTSHSIIVLILRLWFSIWVVFQCVFVRALSTPITLSSPSFLGKSGGRVSKAWASIQPFFNSCLHAQCKSWQAIINIIAASAALGYQRSLVVAATVIWWQVDA